MYINLRKLKAPEIRKLAKAYNKQNLIPHPSTLKKDELIKYLKEHLETNNKGHINLDTLHPKLKKTIQPAIDRLKEQYEEAKKELEKTIKDIEEDIKKNKKKEKTFIPYRDTLTQEERDEQDKRLKYFLETGKIYTEVIETPKTKKEIKELEAREKAVKKLLDEEAKEKAEARSKFNQEIMKKVREELKAKKEATKPTKKQKKVPEEKEEEDDDETPEEKKMRAYFASIKDPQQRMKEVREYMIKQREAIRKKVEAREKK
jgi:hypothetical protein